MANFNTQSRPLTYGCLIILIVMFSMNWILDDATDTLGLVTVNTFIADKQVWNLITCLFYENNPAKVALDIASIIIATKSIKIVGGFDQFCLYMGVCSISCTLGTSAYCFIRYFSTGLEEMIMTPIYGFNGIVVIVLTYARQQLRGEAIIPQIPQITFNNILAIIILMQLMLWFVGLKNLALDFPFTVIATLVSWSYLRFYYKFDDSPTGDLGDPSDEFSFVNMFPEVRCTLLSFTPFVHTKDCFTSIYSSM